MGGLISLMALEADQNRPDIQGLLLLSAAVKIHPDAGPNWLIALAKLGGCLAPWFKPPRTFGVEMVCRNKVQFFFRALDFEIFFFRRITAGLKSKEKILVTMVAQI